MNTRTLIPALALLSLGAPVSGQAPTQATVDSTMGFALGGREELSVALDANLVFLREIKRTLGGDCDSQLALVRDEIDWMIGWFTRDFLVDNGYGDPATASGGFPTHSLDFFTGMLSVVSYAKYKTLDTHVERMLVGMADVLETDYKTTGNRTVGWEWLLRQSPGVCNAEIAEAPEHEDWLPAFYRERDPARHGRRASCG